MTGNDADRFTALLATVGEFYDVTVSEARATLYFRTLMDFEYPIVEAAFGQYMRTDASKYGFPKPAHIREIVEGSQSDQEAVAWMAVNDAIRRFGSWQSIIVADPSLADAIVRTFGSWMACCAAATENSYLWEQKRKEFVAAYRIARKIARRSTEPVLLTGLAEVQNRSIGRFPKRQPYGVILLDGRTEDRYLDINTQNGLPAAMLSHVLALPAIKQRALPARREEQETGPDISAEKFVSIQDAIARILAAKQFPQKMARVDRRQAEDTRDEAGRRRIREQAKQHGADVQAQQTSGAVRARKAATARNANHTSDHGGKPAATGTGVSVRKTSRKKMGRGSRVAGVEDSVRAGRQRVRQRDPLRAGQLDNGSHKGRK
jgi:hypothetical protein